MSSAAAQGRRGRGPAIAVIVIGVGLALAPAVFQMFSRAPKGGDMIEQFRPYMTTGKIDRFRGYLDEIDAADKAASRLPPSATASGGAVGELHRQWPGIDADMGDMLATMRTDIGRFRGVSALPPFLLFPWFFVIPGLIAAALGLLALRATRRGPPRLGLHRAMVVLGLGVLAAPAMFQMFTRAPGGAAMIDDFRPLMTERKVTTVQGYFLTIGAAEGELRNQVVPALGTPPDVAITTFMRDWPRISNEMAPMIGTMADNVGNFAAVDALPPFWLFPWFFVIPGLLVVGLAVPGARRRRAVDGTAVTSAKHSIAAVLTLVAVVGAGCGGSTKKAGAGSTGRSLVGTFRLTAGTCGAQGATGSTFRMLQPGGKAGTGPFVINGDSSCADKTWTTLRPGRDGGLRTGSYQAQPTPPFDATGNAVSNGIAQPQKWFAVAFSLATNQKDPQTGTAAPLPRVVLSGTSLSGDLSALAASWNGQHFNQGAPKPGGARPGNTTGPTGTYDAATHHYTLEWSSQIVGGPFNNFTGVWHLEGTFEPA